jgi:hypothetical protein
MPALDAPGGSLTSASTVGGASHGRARVKPVRGIGLGVEESLAAR